MKWLYADWWAYLLHGKPSLRMVLCRAKGHEGPVFYRCSGDEPDWSCRGCGEDLG